jgi:hypothetical protein
MHAVKSYDMGPTALLPLRRRRATDFYDPKKPTASTGFDPPNLGSNGISANNYTTEATKPEILHRPPARDTRTVQYDSLQQWF